MITMRPWFALSLALVLGCTSGDADPPASAGGGGGSATTGSTSGTATGGAGGAPSGSPSAGGSGGDVSIPFEPLFADDFESYTDGQPLSPLPDYDAAGRTIASDEQVFRGQMAARMAIESGDAGGFGQWGFIIPFQPLEKGREIWVRLAIWWPQSFEFSATPWMKFLRLHARTGDGSNGGYNDLYVDEADSTTSVLRTIKEVHNVWDVYDGAPIPRGQWESYEMYLFIDDVPADDGGSGRFRIWRDDELIFDRTDVPTITEASGDIDALYVFTYWNNEMPPNNHCFMDDLILATDASPPTNVDAEGNVFIGDYTW
ncbi:MAG: hypothetical protein RIF41_17505 [Polyangiaceae bacterium]